jgi:hypothetical protein
MTSEEIAALQKELEEQKAKNAELAAEKDALEKAISEGKAKPAPVTFKVKDDEKNGIEGGTYEFTCPTVTHKGEVINIRQLEADAKKDKKALEKYQSLCATLVVKRSGAVRRKEGK